MKIVLLGGNSIRNISWLEGMEAALKNFNFYDDIFVHRYLHWDTGESLIDLDKELKLLRKELGGVGRYVIIGKSAGTLLTLKGVYEHELTPAACVFLGTAVSWGREEGFDIDSWLRCFSVPTLFIHKSDDPAIMSNALETLLQKSDFKNYNLHVMPGNEHEYSEYQELSRSITSFLKDKHLIN